MDEPENLGQFFAGMLKASLQSIDKRDYTLKQVGDRVITCDISNMRYLHEVKTEECVISKDATEYTNDNIELNAQIFIVIAIDVEHEFKCNYCPNTHIHNIILYCPHTKKKYYSSQHDVSLL